MGEVYYYLGESSNVWGRNMSSMRNAVREDEDDLLDPNLKLSPPSSGEGHRNLAFRCIHMQGVGPGGGFQHGGEVYYKSNMKNAAGLMRMTF